MTHFKAHKKNRHLLLQIGIGSILTLFATQAYGACESEQAQLTEAQNNLAAIHAEIAHKRATLNRLVFHYYFAAVTTSRRIPIAEKRVQDAQSRANACLVASRPPENSVAPSPVQNTPAPAACTRQQAAYDESVRRSDELEARYEQDRSRMKPIYRQAYLNQTRAVAENFRGLQQCIAANPLPPTPVAVAPTPVVERAPAAISGNAAGFVSTRRSGVRTAPAR
ncbi:MAG: hypothetical protein AB7N80_13725 [Bdellovibrionales bacterium]